VVRNAVLLLLLLLLMMMMLMNDNDVALSSVIVNDVMFVSSMSVNWLSRKLYWIDSAKVRILYALVIFWVAKKKLLK